MGANDLQVRWKHHQVGVMDYLRQLLASEVFVDVTLCCQNRRFKAHRILLSSCSSYLQQVLVEHVASDHVTIILPDVHPEDMQWLLDFMYTGSVAVPRRRLSSFLQAAEALHIKILTDMAQLYTADSGSVVCSPALDFTLTNDPNFRQRLKYCSIKQCNLTEDCKHSSCNNDAKFPSESSRLQTNKLELMNVTEDSKSSLITCSLDTSSYGSKGVESIVGSNSVSCEGTTLSTSSLYDGLSNGANFYEGPKGKSCIDGEDLSRKGAAVVVSGCNTDMTHNADDKNSRILGHPSDTSLTYPETRVYNKPPCGTKTLAEDLNSSQNTSTSSGNHKSVNKAQEEWRCGDTTAPSVENFPSAEYGCELNSSNDFLRGNSSKITPNMLSSDTGVTVDFPLRNQADNTGHCSLYLQRLSQWPKPLPSLMPIGNSNTRCNGQIPACYLSKHCTVNGSMTHIVDRKHTLPEDLRSMKDVIPNSEPWTGSMAADQRLPKEHRCSTNLWFSSRDKVMHLNGQRPGSDCRLSRILSHRAHRLSPIVPPSPWAQNLRPPCATPVAVNYQPASWTAPPAHTAANRGGENRQPDYQQQLGDLTGPLSCTQVAKVNPTGSSAVCPPLQINKGPDQTTPVQQTASEQRAVFCKLNARRRLEECYTEQTTRQLRTVRDGEAAASDLSTKPPQSPGRSPSECRKMTSSPLTVSLQQKLKTLSELSSPKLSACDGQLSYKENAKEDSSTKLRKDCGTEADSKEVKTEQIGSASSDDRTIQVSVIGSEQDNGLRCVQEDCDVKLLHDTGRTTFTKNDNNNNSNNNNGLLDECAQGATVGKSHGCEDCGKCFSRRQLLVQHRRIHTGERPYSCADCGRQFTQRGHWSTHQKLHEPARRPEHACPSCGKAFVTRASLKVHLRTHTGEKPFQCGECGKQFSQLRNYKYHRSVHEGTREFAATCPECGKYFNDRGYLSSHMKIHRNRKEYGCQYCGKSFNQRVAYNMHVRIHTGERPHSCPHCNKSFSRKMLLKQHLRIHTGEKPFACSVCGKAFADRSNMTLHMRLHSGIKPYSCQLCAKAFTKKHHLKTHLNYHTGTKPYSCNKCGLRFSQSSNMRTHYKKCSGRGLPTVETSEATTAPVTNNNGAMSPSSSPGRNDVTMTSPQSSSVAPHSDESSCGSSVPTRNATEALPV